MIDRDLVLLTGADSTTGRKLIERLAETEWFRETYEVRAVTDGSSGRAVEALAKRNVPTTEATDPRTPADAIELVANGSVDYLVACGWLYKIPPDAVALADRAAINCHPSYLPAYRGLHSHWHQWAHAEAYGGVTVHFISEEFDEGDVVAQARFHIELWDTPLDIFRKFCDLTPVVLREALALLEHSYGGTSQGEGHYYSAVKRSTAIGHGLVNHVLRAASIDWRWEIKPTR
jgi:folate-dependent phosphoribosylglycinamide formyltransferase PurN